MTPDADRAEFDRGVAEGEEPLGPADGPAVVTAASRWVARPCPVCRHTFRLGDRVAA